MVGGDWPPIPFAWERAMRIFDFGKPQVDEDYEEFRGFCRALDAETEAEMAKVRAKIDEENWKRERRFKSEVQQCSIDDMAE
jgi:hypothetical protein